MKRAYNLLTAALTVALTVVGLGFGVSSAIGGPVSGSMGSGTQFAAFCLAVEAHGSSYPVRVLRGNIGCNTARSVLRHFLRKVDRSHHGWTSFYGHGQDTWSVTAFRGPERSPTAVVRAFNPI